MSYFGCDSPRPSDSTATECLVQIDYGEQLITLGLGQRGFRVEQLLLRFQHFKVIGSAGVVSVERQVDGLA